MMVPGEALAGVLLTMHPRNRSAFLRYLTRKAEMTGDLMYLEEIAAYHAGQFIPAPSAGAGASPRAKPVLRLVAKDET